MIQTLLGGRAHQQFTKTCALEDCRVTFEGNANSLYCSNPHKQRAIWRRKKAERGDLLMQNSLPASTEPVYLDYKEPLKKLDEGFGYQGTVAVNAEGTHIQCHICGVFYTRLGQHVGSHKTTARQYKEEFGLGVTTSLVAPATREALARDFDERWSDERLQRLRVIAHDVNASGRNKQGGQKSKQPWHLERRNKQGNCPDQVIQKINSMAEDLGRAPSWGEFCAEFGTGLAQTAVYHFGSWVGAVNTAGHMSAMELRVHDRFALLDRLNDFTTRFGREPLKSDIKSSGFFFASYNAYYRAFGGLPEARQQAARLRGVMNNG